jgi:hypothetical protein
LARPKTQGSIEVHVTHTNNKSNDEEMGQGQRYEWKKVKAIVHLRAHQKWLEKCTVPAVEFPNLLLALIELFFLEKYYNHHSNAS